MAEFDHVPLIGDVPALETVYLSENESSCDLVLRSVAPYRRFAMQVADERSGLLRFATRELSGVS